MKRITVDSYVFPDRVGDVQCDDVSLTQQHFANDVDVNTIVSRALKTGLLSDPDAIANRRAVFGDFSEIGSFHDSLNKIKLAEAAFMELPVNVRMRFDNDPGKLMEFVGDIKNLKEAVDLGLVPEKVWTDKVAAEAAAEAAAAEAAKKTVPPAV